MAISCKKAAKALRAMPKTILDAEVAAMKTTVALAVREAQRLSSGAFKSKGEYSRRNPHPPFDPAIINAQSGEFRSAWRGLTLISSTTVTGRVINASLKADWLDKGTPKMISRPIRLKLEAFAAPLFQRELKRELANRFKNF